MSGTMTRFPAMAFDLADPFHISQVVHDLESAMDQVGAALDLEWHTVQERPMPILWDGEPHESVLRFTYSKGGAPHYELQQGEPGSLWGADYVGMHHVGVWTDDFFGDVAALEAAGFRIEATMQSEDGRPSYFTYQISPHGLRIELLPIQAKPYYERWFETGVFA